MASPAKSTTSSTSIDEQQEDFCYTMQLRSLAALPMVLYTAVELKLFQIISKAGPGAHLSASEIAAQLQSLNPEAPAMVDRILRLLASHAVVTCSLADDGEGRRRVYGLGPVCKYFIPNKEDGVSLGPVTALANDKVFSDSWYKLKESIIEGGVPFCDYSHAFEHPGKDPKFNEVFNKGMYNHTTIVIKNILESTKVSITSNKLSMLVVV